MVQIDTICSFCQKQFMKKNSAWKTTEKLNQNHYCSKQCYINSRKGKKFKTKYKKILINCDNCKISFKKNEKLILNSQNVFCSRACRDAFTIGKKRVYHTEIKCSFCNNIFYKRPSYIKYQKKYNKHIFCSKICVGKFYSHIIHVRSKIELYIEKMINLFFPEIRIYCNGKYYGYELDIYFPQQNMAIELNGPFHYLPLNGINKLIRLQSRDIIRKVLCKNANVNLYVFPILGNSKFNKYKDKIWYEIKNLINIELNKKKNNGEGFPMKSIKNIEFTLDDIIYHAINDN